MALDLIITHKNYGMQLLRLENKKTCYYIMIHIVTSFFISKLSSANIDERNAELVTTLQNNVASPFIDKIHLFIDDEPSMIVKDGLIPDDDVLI